ncbi:MAG TPA: orotidine-5'-phosphate decarboxylase [Gemmataceae bacterium]|jgi:orotidine-5'-phosphate decarboxylase|nr:orotidine-5'-phosphate decarboxylase [Gemmataceae bacterium]
MDHFADRLVAAIRAKATPLCVGLDPRWDSLPLSVRKRHAGNVATAYEEFCFGVLDILAPLVAVIKPQSAFFEAAGPAGMMALQQIILKAKRLGLLTILDAKRGDIASTASAYAEAAFSIFDADAVTINPYLGRDSVEPFLQFARKDGRGVFVLVRTSNSGAGQFQDLDCGSKPLYQRVAEEVRSWSRENLGQCGFGDVGAVVGATHPAELTAVRKLLPDVWFLVPGFGAQGGTAAEVAAAFRPDGLGAIVNSSRGVMFPFSPDDRNWEAAIESAARQAIQALPLRKK